MRRPPRRYPDAPAGPLAPRLTREEVLGCPVRSSLGLFGRKWAPLLLRDLAFYPGITFGQIRRRNPGMTPRVLSLRLREFREAGLVDKTVDRVDDRVFHYRLTPKGTDALPILAALSAFGLKHFAHAVFRDRRPRTMSEVFPGQAASLLGDLWAFAHEAPARGDGSR